MNEELMYDKFAFHFFYLSNPWVGLWTGVVKEEYSATTKVSEFFLVSCLKFGFQF